jgi:SOS regulatory protein LexA
MAETLNSAERRVLEVLCSAVRRVGGPPSLEEIRKSAELSSVASVHFLLSSLWRKGFIRRDESRPRVIEVFCSRIDAEQVDSETASVATTESVAIKLVKEERRTDTAARSGPQGFGEGSGGRGSPRDQPTPGEQLNTGASEQEGADTQPTDAVTFGRGAWTSAVEPEVAAVPLVGQVAAGNPISAIPGEVEETYRLPRDFVGRGDPLFMVQVRGDSMTDAGIHDRDFVVVHRQLDAEIGELVVVLDQEGDAAVKRLWRGNGGRPVLLSANPAYPPLALKEAEMVGRVVTVIRKLR